MEKYIELNCSVCGKPLKRKLKKYKYECKKHGQNYKPVCHFSCGKSVKVKCKNCGKEFKKTKSNINKTKQNFCSSSCFATFNNKIRPTNVGTKQLNCKCCNSVTTVSKHSSKAICNDCRKQYRDRRKGYRDKLVKRNCAVCNCEILAKASSNKKYCDMCRHNIRVKTGKRMGKIAGKLSAAKQVRRSKNEIYFAELCKKHFSLVSTNEPFFNSKHGKWDADVIIHEHKLAVLWNGVWHYKQVRKNHSLKQVQTRDKIKLDVIKANGYSAYIVKDMGKYNKKFVEEEFEKLISVYKQKT